MIRDRTAETRTPARSVYRLTKEEAGDAIFDYVRKNTASPLPAGKRFVWVQEEQSSREEPWLVTLVIDENSVPTPTPQEPTNA